MTHRVAIRDAIVQRVLARRGRLHLYDALEARRRALLVIDMQTAFVARGAPVEVRKARGIVPAINRLAAELRRRGVPVVWVLHENLKDGKNWSGFFDVFVAPERRAQAAGALAAGSEMPRPWPELEIAGHDLSLT